jgi:hypothetical protein
MKKIHIVLLVFIAAAIAVLISFLQTTSTYDTIDTARAKAGKFVHLMAREDKSKPQLYDPLTDPNFFSFTAIDTLGNTVKVNYNKPKPENFDISPSLVLQGKYINGEFECTTINTKCPSKYKDDIKTAEKKITPAKESASVEKSSANYN